MTAPVPSAAAMWRSIGAGWRQLFGDFRGLGVSFEWHEFTPRENLDWSRSFHPESLELCLNLAGTGEVGPPGQSVKFTPGTAGFYRQGKTPLRSLRFAGEALPSLLAAATGIAQASADRWVAPILGLVLLVSALASRELWRTERDAACLWLIQLGVDHDLNLFINRHHFWLALINRRL